ncbi:MAG: type II toxin-antitoxin system RelE/ParE family toxin [Candidatus Omnitrophica bacterium]|nr:type II toxin-antitoxin system RelE/ParE family toxin [Candidatus Omnitrophota bacterium]
MKVFIRPLAVLDMERSVSYIWEESPNSAANFYDACRKTFEFLERNPHIGPKYPVSNKKLLGIRFFPVIGFKKYLVFYFPQKIRIEIVRLLHTARDISGVIGG